MLSNIGLTLEQLKKLPNSEARARLLHAGQTYGNGWNFYDMHTGPVKKKAVAIARAIKKTFNLTEHDIKIIWTSCDYHDSIEDQLITYEELKKLEWKEVADIAEILNKRNPDQSYKPHYYPLIARNIKTKIIKYSDRYENIKATEYNTSIERIEHHMQDYNTDWHNYNNYEIGGAEAIHHALTNLNIVLELRKEIKQNFGYDI